MRMGQGVRTGLGHGGITCVLSSVHTVRLISEIFVSDTNLYVCTALMHVS